MNIKVGSKVKITDGSGAINLSQDYIHSSIGKSDGVFQVVKTGVTLFCIHEAGGRMHDIIIEELDTGDFHLHSSSMVKMFEGE